MPIVGAPGDAWEVRVIGKIENQETDNVFHFVEDSATSDVELNLILALAECFLTHLVPVLSSQWQMTSIKWKKVSPVLGVEQETIPAGILIGAGNAAALPSYCSAVVSKRTLVGGRSHRGRFYIPGIPEPATINSSLDTGHAFWIALIAFVACVTEKFVNVGEPIGSDQFSLSVYSRKIGGSSTPFGAAGFTPVSQLIPSAALGTTRSRKVGRGA
jgi:hypothetical protein